MMRTIFCCLIIIFSGVMAPNPASRDAESKNVRLREIIKIVRQLKQYVNNTDPEALPAPENVKNGCELSAFQCFQKAKLKAASKHESLFTRSFKQLQRIKRLTKNPLPRREHPGVRSELQCAPCDSYEKKAPLQFLDSLISLLQKMINSHF